MPKKKTRTRKRASTTDTEGSEQEEELGEDVYVVEKVVDKKVENGVVHYLLKWKDYPSDDNTWEPEVNVGCAPLIAKFEKELEEKEAKEKAATGRKADDKSEKKKDPEDPDPELRETFEPGMEAKEIIGATMHDGELAYLIMWTRGGEPDLVPSRIAREKWPEVVIKYFEGIFYFAQLDASDGGEK